MAPATFPVRCINPCASVAGSYSLGSFVTSLAWGTCGFFPCVLRGLQEYGLVWTVSQPFITGAAASTSLSPGAEHLLRRALSVLLRPLGGMGQPPGRSSPTTARWGQRWEQQPCLSLRTQASTDVRAGTGLGRLRDTQLAGVQLLSMNILGGGWPEVRKGRWVGEIK